ncbi:cytochrome P450 [Decorospora gaudefroyi]|uniref:Cytochrome P450 n=1 Tax=Decorospora gaudefroyi TaxID=184978 RepID=A0A6A5KTZ2_9PLEO|nr:cytochrome P450 [Decorospora gaudefroyi]
MATTLTRLVELVRSKPFAASLALVTHYVLHSDEWENSFHVFLGIWTVAFGGIAVLEYVCDSRAQTLGLAIQITATAATIYFGTLATSILLHRVFFHRLRGIPGPVTARFTKFHSIFAGVLPKFQYFKYVRSLHQKYRTDVIRTGPREVTVYCADAIPLVHGPLSKCTKASIYTATELGGSSVHTTRNKQEHRERRKIWDQAFSAKALREYEPRLNRHARALMEKLGERAGKETVRITNWVNFCFDVMGDVGFNRSFGMVEKGEEADAIKLLHEATGILSILSHLSWALNLASRTSAGAKPLLDHMKWSAEILEERTKARFGMQMLMTPKENDVISWLLNPHDDRITPGMNADTRLLVVAGSDTVSATLSFLFYELCLNPSVQAKLRKIIDAIMPEKAHLDVNDLADCPFLDGVINEALRLHPAVPSGPVRETPPEGFTLPNGTYIPGNIHIWTPIYTLQRDARYFQDPLTFMPERWTDERPGAVIDKRAFLPFITGVYNCVGQKLAMLEMRSVTANLVRRFEMGFAEGEDGRTIEDGSRDCFTMNVGKLDVWLTERERV